MMRGMVNKIIILVVSIIGLLLFVSPVFSPQPADLPPEPLVTVTVYFANADASALRAEQRQIRQTDQPARAAVEALLTGAKAEGSFSVIPAGTKLRGFAVQHGVAYVDFTNDMLNTPNRGSASEVLIVSSIVNTLTEFAGIDRVQLLIEGKEVETLYGHMDLTQPFTRFR